MANKGKKTKRRVNRRLKRTVMGTLSAVLMASAVIVALIPVPKSKAAVSSTDLEAAMITDATAVPDKNGTKGFIPDYVGNDYPVFANSDGNFRVAYGSNGSTMKGIINYYNVNNVVSNAALTIPSEINAFLYNWDKSEYIAVNKDREFLYYFSQEQADETYNEDGSVNTPAQDAVLSPCVASAEDVWLGQKLYVVAGGDGIEDITLVSGNSIDYKASEQLVISVEYVGSTRYEVDLNKLKTGDEDGTYYAQDKSPGVFEGATNFATLVIPDKILAIGNNAFKGCQMQSVKIENGIGCIGNNAFQDCNQLSNVGFVEPTQLQEIGDYAFAGCTYLTSVKIPDQVQKLGNYAFKDCVNLSAVGLNGMNEDGNTQLTTIGSGLFYNCSSLAQVVFPERVSNIDQVQYTTYGCASMTYLGLPNHDGSGDHVFKYNNVTGCSSLDTVKVPARELKLDCKDAEYESTGYDDIYTGAARDIFSKENLGENSAFQDSYEVSDEFCIMANSQSYSHSYAQKHGLAFGYLDPGYVGWYEKIVDGYAFRVDQTNTLVNFEKVDELNDGSNVIIPDNIAKYHVGSIASNTFQNNTEVEYLYIPESVSTIAAGAFKGCTSLRTVNFDNALAIREIGSEAFKTGVTLSDIDTDGSGDGIPDENLCFIGDISSACVPFNYAMDVNNNYNASSAPTQYITYTSGFPQNLQIQMVVEKNENTNAIEDAYPVVVAIPTEAQLQGNGSYSLSTYDGKSDYVRTKAQENEIVAEANRKYLNNLDPSKSPMVLTEEEQAVIDAVYHVKISDGIKGLKDDLFNGNTAVKSVILETVEEVPDYEFSGCTSLTTFIMGNSGAEGGEIIGEKAFEGCKSLTEVSLPDSVSQLTSVPFAGCSMLEDVDFNGSPNFVCEDCIIKGIGEDGTMSRIVECLETRGVTSGAARLSADDFAGIKSIDPAAFQNCTGIREAYLDESEVTIIPDYCFDGASSLYYCSLSDTVKKIGKYAFRNTALSTISIPGNVQGIDDTAFITEADGKQEYIQGLTVECAEDSPAYWYCQDKKGITAQTYTVEFTVTFLDWDDYVLSTQKVKKGASAVAPRTYREGYALTGWTEKFDNVKEDIVTKAIYEESNAPEIDGYYSVIFRDEDGKYTWDIQYLKEGEYPKAPDVTPYREGYIFSYWSPSNFETIAVTGNLIVKAFYNVDPNYTPDEPGDDEPGNGNDEPGNGNDKPGSGNDEPGDGNDEPGDGTKPTGRHTVKFVDHDGTVLDTQLVEDGSCPTETTVVPTRKGYVFSTWSPSNYASVPVTGDMKIKALYRKDTSNQSMGDNSGNTSSDSSKEPGSDNSGNGNSDNTGNGNDTQKPGTGNGQTQTQTGNSNVAGGSVTKPSGSVSGNQSSTINRNDKDTGTKVVVTKTGISNKDLVSAKVSGANDNFVVKVSDSTDARSAVEAALLKKYGSLDHLKYFAMDISLYDSTGTTKIADTTGITVTITLPLPDVLAGYAGNNKAGAVKNGTFETLNSRLTSIDNVPCITFDATHFSPYAIYVETDNLTSGVVDVTPTTGDPIHPKWFLSIGLALLSVLLFLGKGSKNKIVKVIE